MDFFVARSIYLLMHKLKMSVYRNLFRKAYLVEGKTQIKIEVFVCAVRACGCEDVEPEQVSFLSVSACNLPSSQQPSEWPDGGGFFLLSQVSLQVECMLANLINPEP